MRTVLVLGLDRLETASFLRSNGTFQYLTGLPGFPDPQTLRRFLLHAPDSFWKQVHRVNDRLRQTFIHLPSRRSRLIFDLDSTMVTVFGKQEDAVGYNPRYRGKRSYDPLLCVEATHSISGMPNSPWKRWDVGWQCRSVGHVLHQRAARYSLRVRADAGFGFNPVLVALEARHAEYAVVARLTQAFRRLLPSLTYQSINRCNDSGRGYPNLLQATPIRPLLRILT